MLETIKSYIKELPDIDFDTYYQTYICNIQDSNVISEIGSIGLDTTLSLDKLIAKLHKELLSGNIDYME